MNPDAQEGGTMEPSKDSGGGPKIGATTIDMKIQLVDDKTTLPSYLIPNLKCDDGLTHIPNSKVSITLKGDSLRAETTPTNFKCEITSNFLTGSEKSAITIETYYAGDKVNTIYFDDSLLRYYNNETPSKLIESPNPFLATATTADSGVTYTFEFDFDTIIKAIEALPSYGQIQNMFMFVNGIPGTGVNKKTLIQISAGGFLNLKFSGVPFNSVLTTGSTLTLNIATTNDPIPAGCTLTKLFGSDILKDKVHKVLELTNYTDFDFSNMTKAPVPQPVTHPVVDSAAAAGAATGTAAAAATTGATTGTGAATTGATTGTGAAEEQAAKLAQEKAAAAATTETGTGQQGQQQQMQCGKGDISMESRDGSLIFKVPYDKILSEIGPNMRSAMARKVLVRNATDPNAAKQQQPLLLRHYKMKQFLIWPSG